MTLHFALPYELNGYLLVGAHAHISPFYRRGNISYLAGEELCPSQKGYMEMDKEGFFHS